MPFAQLATDALAGTTLSVLFLAALLVLALLTPLLLDLFARKRLRKSFEDTAHQRAHGDCFPAPILSSVSFHKSEYRIRSETE